MPLFQNWWDGKQGTGARCVQCSTVFRSFLSLEAHTDAACAAQQKYQHKQGDQNAATSATQPPQQPGPSAYEQADDEPYDPDLSAQ